MRKQFSTMSLDLTDNRLIYLNWRWGGRSTRAQLHKVFRNICYVFGLSCIKGMICEWKISHARCFHPIYSPRQTCAFGGNSFPPRSLSQNQIIKIWSQSCYFCYSLICIFIKWKHKTYNLLNFDVSELLWGSKAAERAREPTGPGKTSLKAAQPAPLIFRNHTSTTDLNPTPPYLLIFTVK